MKSRKIGPARQAVEAVLRDSKTALSAQQIAAQSGIEPTLVRAHICNIMNEGMAHNQNPAQKNKGLYVWGPAPKPEPLPQLRDTPARPGTYTGEKGGSTRPGAMDAYRIPSLGDVERKRPLIIGARVEPVGVNGGRI